MKSCVRHTFLICEERHHGFAAVTCRFAGARGMKSRFVDGAQRRLLSPCARLRRASISAYLTELLPPPATAAGRFSACSRDRVGVTAGAFGRSSTGAPTSRRAFCGARSKPCPSGFHFRDKGLVARPLFWTPLFRKASNAFEPV